MYGCDEELSQPYKLRVGDYYFSSKRCFNLTITNMSGLYLQAYRLFEKGFFPNGIAWLNESSKFIKMMAIIENLVSDFQEEEVKKGQNNG